MADSPALGVYATTPMLAAGHLRVRQPQRLQRFADAQPHGQRAAGLGGRGDDMV
ncbi:MAG: hypothetical protein V4476_16235 [Pseudomonadota bacterium]